MIPNSSNYPDAFDTDKNLYSVHDSLRVRLASDYNVGDKSISIEDIYGVMDKFPPNGLITLTEQVSSIDDRAISFYYNSKTSSTFDELELLSGFNDVQKLKRITTVTQNVMADHHNNIKDSIIAIENFIGTKGTIDLVPLGNTMEGRTNFLRKLIFTPRAWFSCNVKVGLIPLVVEFQEQCFRLGEGPVTFTWDFGDNTSSNISVVTYESIVPTGLDNVLVNDPNGNKITKTYTNPGIYNVSLTVKNEFGEDIVQFNQLINARVEAPDTAIIEFVPRNNQIIRTLDGYQTIRSPINTFIDNIVPRGNLNPSRTYAGEALNGVGEIIDPIKTYTWKIADDLSHPQTYTTRSSFSIGGIYDLGLRVDTEFGDYRITKHSSAFDIIENRNLWLFNFIGTSSLARANEFGLIGETFKTASQTQTITRDDSFLDNIGEYDPTSGTYPASIRGKREFKRNTGFTKQSTTNSSDQGLALICWASGGAPSLPIGSQTVNFMTYEGFSDIYDISPFPTVINRPWNWVFLPSESKVYFAFGPDPAEIPNTNGAYNVQTVIDISPSYAVSSRTFSASNYINGAGELQEFTTSGYMMDGEPNDGRFAVYRSAWKDQSGYFLRNDGVGSFFRLKTFYKTEGILSDPFINIKKLPDIIGNTKEEGQLVNLASGIFFFSNSGNIAAYNDTTGIWETGGPSASSPTFRSLQDATVPGFDSSTNTLLAASDGDRLAYLSFDYSSNAFVKFNTADLTFTGLGARPVGEQWIAGIY